MQPRLVLPLFLIFLSTPVWSQFVPNRYIVELNDPPAAAVAMNASPVRSSATRANRAAIRENALRQREAVRSRQQAIRTRAAAAGAEVLGSVDLVANALFVRADSATAATLAATEGVRRVLPVRKFQRVLDRAVAVHQVDQAWANIGLENAGAGIKIAILDSGVDSNHAGMRGDSLTAPEGFPRFGQSVDAAFTNSKVIVARSYVNLLSARDPDVSARDRVGHGTALAMIAAGAPSSGPLGAITGVAPKAYIGSYKIFGSPGFNDSATDDAILQAIEDAVADGMDILNMSFGTIFAPKLDDDPDVRAIERAAAMGVLTIAAAGNEGPEFTTLSSPGTAPSAITVGAMHNDRTYSPSAAVTGLPAMVSVNTSRPGTAPVTGPLVDAETLDPTGMVCEALPSGSLTGKIVLILRGVCTFEVKLVFAARAGAVGALVYTDAERPDALSMEVGTATLPAQMLSYADGIAVKRSIASAADATPEATLDFTVRAVTVDPRRMASFSSTGPSVDLGMKPEIVAVGTDFYTATQSFDIRGDMYNRTGYTVVDGTSFSTPFVAGIAALIKAAKPGLTVEQYRSLIINTASTLPAMQAQISGAGAVDALAAYRSTVTASPAVINLGASGGTPAIAGRNVEVRSVNGSDDTYEVSVEPSSDSPAGAAPSVDQPSIAVAGEATSTFQLSWNAEGLAPGTYQGYVVLRGASSGNTLRIPYWHAVRSEPKRIMTVYADSSPRAFALDAGALIFRVLDQSGVPLLDVVPEVTVVSGTATVEAVKSVDADLPGAFSVDIRFASLATATVFEVRAGNAVARISLP